MNRFTLSLHGARFTVKNGLSYFTLAVLAFQAKARCSPLLSRYVVASSAALRPVRPLPISNVGVVRSTPDITPDTILPRSTLSPPEFTNMAEVPSVNRGERFTSTLDLNDVRW